MLMGVYDVKQLIIVRKELGMNKGKLAAQVAHASLGAVLKMAKKEDRNYTLDCYENMDLDNWLNGSFAKVVLSVRSEEELKECYELARKHGFPCAYIEDNGTTVFNGVKTATCLGIGPVASKELDAVYGHLSLY